MYQCGPDWCSNSWAAIRSAAQPCTVSSSSYREGGYAIVPPMSHTIREKQKLLARVRRIRGQVEAVERALENEVGCEQVMHLLASTRAAMAGLTAQVVEDHVRTHLVEAKAGSGAGRHEAAEQLLSVFRTYLR